MTRILVVGAHPDDPEFGAGGLIQSYEERMALILTLGSRGGGAAARETEAYAAAKVLRLTLELHQLPDTRLDVRDAIEPIEAAVRRFAPDVVATCSGADVHQDHLAVHHATLIATRDFTGTVLAYMTPSAAEKFRPNWFIALDKDDMRVKLEAIHCHDSQRTRSYMSDAHILSMGTYWAMINRMQAPFAEPFELVRHREE
jgi:LmbE family N-acetylglucosaminyl deacetylase